MDLPAAAGNTNNSLRLSSVRRPTITECHRHVSAGHVTAMNPTELQLRGVEDRRLSVHATSVFPAWLWSIDGTRISWANPVGARLFGAANAAALARRTFGPADPHRRQVAQLAGKLASSGAIRLERLHGFGAPLGALATCACARLEFADGHPGILMVSAAPAGRAMPLLERLQRLVQDTDMPMRRSPATACSSPPAMPHSRCSDSTVSLKPARRRAHRSAAAGPRRNAGRHRPFGSAAGWKRRGCRPGGAVRPAAAQTGNGCPGNARRVEIGVPRLPSRPMPEYERPALSAKRRLNSRWSTSSPKPTNRT